eukprot:4097251-Amphidinium_carterae.1
MLGSLKSSSQASLVERLRLLRAPHRPMVSKPNEGRQQDERGGEPREQEVFILLRFSSPPWGALV